MGELGRIFMIRPSRACYLPAALVCGLAIRLIQGRLNPMLFYSPLSHSLYGMFG
jgi:hypothetical protein